MKKIIASVLFSLISFSAFAQTVNVADIKTTIQAQEFVASTIDITKEQLDTIKANVESYSKLSEADFNKVIIVPMLGTAKSNALYQSMFKAYVFNMAKTSNREACKIIANELKVFVATIDENNEDQIKWLNRLRLYYAVYSEL